MFQAARTRSQPVTADHACCLAMIASAGSSVNQAGMERWAPKLSLVRDRAAIDADVML